MSAPSAMDSPGQLLRSARIRAGLSLAQVASRARLTATQLEALERDDWGALPALFYARGFLKLYAREVGLDPEAPVALLDAHLARHEQREDLAAHHADAAYRAQALGGARRALLSVAALALLALGVFFALSGLDAPPTSARGLDAPQQMNTP